MRMYAPLYEGDSILRPDAALGESALRVFRSPAPAPDIVRSNIQVEAANETALDIHVIEQIARTQRNAEISRLLNLLFKKVGDWFERLDCSERDRFFAESDNLCELEQRQRHYERTGMTHY